MKKQQTPRLTVSPRAILNLGKTPRPGKGEIEPVWAVT